MSPETAGSAGQDRIPTTAARRVCENGRHSFGPPPRPPAGVEPMECQCCRLMMGYYLDGEPFVYVVTTVEAAP